MFPKRILAALLRPTFWLVILSFSALSYSCYLFSIKSKIPYESSKFADQEMQMAFDLIADSGYHAEGIQEFEGNTECHTVLIRSQSERSIPGSIKHIDNLDHAVIITKWPGLLEKLPFKPKLILRINNVFIITSDDIKISISSR